MINAIRNIARSGKAPSVPEAEAIVSFVALQHVRGPHVIEELNRFAVDGLSRACSCPWIAPAGSGYYSSVMAGPTPNRGGQPASFVSASHALTLREAGFTGDALPVELRRLYGIVVSKKQAQNLARAKDKLAPEILRDWEMGDPRGRLEFLFKLAAMPHEKQLQAWKAASTG